MTMFAPIVKRVGIIGGIGDGEEGGGAGGHGKDGGSGGCGGSGGGKQSGCTSSHACKHQSRDAPAAPPLA
eukprot:6178179-Pleurochrysis_carterae.AAC.3